MHDLTKKFVFIHIPGTAISEALAQQCPEAVVSAWQQARLRRRSP